MEDNKEEVEVSREDVKIADISLVPNELLRDTVNALAAAAEWMRVDAPHTHPNKKVMERLLYIQSVRHKVMDITKKLK